MADKTQVRNCCAQCWRITFIVLNVFLFVVGLALLVLGIYLLASSNSLEFVTGNSIASGSVLILIAGFVTMLIALIGILGAAGRWTVLLVIYMVCILIIIIAEVVAGILGFVFQNDVINFTTERSLGAIDDYSVNDTQKDVNVFIDFVQNSFQCCGFESTEDWLDTPFVNVTMTYPDSCLCDIETANITECVEPAIFPNDTLEAPLIWRQSCNESVAGFIDRYLGAIGAVGIAFGILEIFGLGIAIGLTACFCVMRRDENYEFTKAV